MPKIPPLDLERQFTAIQPEISAAVASVLASGNYVGGAAVSDFEQQFAQYVGTDHCIACNSGTDALYLALRALQIGPGDEVITSPFTFIATAEVISRVGATPVFIDIDPNTFNLDPEKLEAAITPRSRAIIPVHLFGQAAAMGCLQAIATDHNLYVIEDCAQAVGATWKDQAVGGIGHVGCFSFYPTKNLGACGDGGAVTTNDPEIEAQIRLLRDHGRRGGYTYETVGVNSRLDSLQAAILSVKLRYLNRWNQQRQAAAERYDQLLQHIPGIVLPKVAPEATSVWNQYTLRITCNKSGERRDLIRQYLSNLEIASMVYYPLPLHLQPVYTALGYQPGRLPHSEQVAHEVLSLPMFPELTTIEQECVRDGLKEALAGT
ncbi:dTDP-3-amino-3,4,6-trideoxy-alpha-D-glucose transaminase [Acaryochloris thomasi RCC1774]|uniref:dTDP-3-amino-3,4,6-trideoxy-alpha-D-glucose transaminase n=1 Tax=Acaryochloris thomasi RCC1774 TaxID=1764569 RepID=A0A2W1JI50_9CYAN|nr:DegT/DnrJ/EryC1/StrS family aminotransferase [Acaryochloris thomasi]PZD72986.1 dTDP-3-amino-3,4,6-trideoxy-alpha-D-glucose transaminase [Acaryochloris thomasi RCC1774]